MAKVPNAVEILPKITTVSSRSLKRYCAKTDSRTPATPGGRLGSRSPQTYNLLFRCFKILYENSSLILIHNFLKLNSAYGETKQSTNNKPTQKHRLVSGGRHYSDSDNYGTLHKQLSRFSSVLWCSWTGDRKGIRPAETPRYKSQHNLNRLGTTCSNSGRQERLFILFLFIYLKKTKDPKDTKMSVVQKKVGTRDST